MVFDLFTLAGFFLFLVMLAALVASHDFRHDPSAGRKLAGRAASPRRRNR